ncbi:hypothetical protein [Propionivibrio sp.]|uniref:hypothetical protein n=1 Tax=Propionivibrio sp. TaxID=2212460 RepID=UPI003BF222E7
MPDQKKQNLLITGLTLIAIVALIAAYFSPIWWVSLTAPNYPKDAFPDGIRIHFHFDKVYNGCSIAAAGTRMSNEILQKDLDETVERYNPILDAKKDANKGAQGLDCVHEMNTINHYVGMFPISTGAPVEKPMAKFFFGFFVAMLLGFIAPEGRRRLLVLAAGFAAVSVWMLVDQYALGHLESHIKSYVTDASTFFNEPEKIKVWGDNVRTITNIVIIGLIVLMGIVLAGVAKIRNFSLLLPLAPALMPVFFVIEYAGWLWFFGHNMHPWGAFTVKPFMPTVFGEGKVAQFSTYSYPYWGYGLLLIAFVCLMLAILLRRKQMRADQAND